MRVVVAWWWYLKIHPRVAKQFEKAVTDANEFGDPKYLDEFYYRITGKEPGTHWDGRTDEYGERAWRIAGKKLSLIVFDEGNGWSHPIGVEFETDHLKPVTEREVRKS